MNAADVATQRALLAEIRSCRRCADAFRATRTAHAPRPVLQASPTARICIAGQAPGRRVHMSGKPFDDPSGDRLRRWLGIEKSVFWDDRRLALLPMGFCFPGHDAKGGDLPPPKSCAAHWRGRLFEAHPQLELVILLGRAALDWHLGPSARRSGLAELAGQWRARLAAPERPRLIAAPHPSWRNNHWLKTHPWFEADAVPAIQRAVAALL
ncbi:MAG: uracil-DNA glycosylase family protein [Pseudomonadota bacterium]